MIFLNIFKLIMIHALIYCALCESTGTEQPSTIATHDENSVLDSVYSAMKQNYETKLSQNLETKNFISEIRNKPKVNELPLLSRENGKNVQKNLFPFELQTVSKVHSMESLNSNQARADQGHVDGHDE